MFCYFTITLLEIDVTLNCLVFKNLNQWVTTKHNGVG